MGKKLPLCNGKIIDSDALETICLSTNVVIL